MAEVITRDQVRLSHGIVTRSPPAGAQLWAVGTVTDVDDKSPRHFTVEIPLTGAEQTALNQLTLKAFNYVKSLEGIP